MGGLDSVIDVIFNGNICSRFPSSRLMFCDTRVCGSSFGPDVVYIEEAALFVFVFFLSRMI